ncbi:hypothetical protein SADUNF_Sadunf16G0047000 [Salix dunnii]|uniref:DNA2/NAM7 helicase-like C-terminal domain-containing protein n=1 Tax=Salix dunnii TaxID=1413687 RepID=A0A835MG10_9ROSI|nr:hypothetical protein SADUNF_Sadunf16G0047000 [Salix dunnii]
MSAKDVGILHRMQYCQYLRIRATGRRCPFPTCTFTKFPIDFLKLPVILLRILKSNDDKLKDMEISTVEISGVERRKPSLFQWFDRTQRKRVGFLSDHRRMNVAVTRARRQCCLVCDTETVSVAGFLKRLIEYFEEHGEYLSASEYLNE